MNKLIITALLAAATTVTAGVLQATEPVRETIVVTATRTAISVDDSLAAVSVIDRHQIEQLQPADFLDLLSLTPGVDVSKNGGRGANASLFLRGTNSGHVLVLVDGVRIGSSTLGLVSLQNIDPDHIERVEIIRGPRSSLYGSEAVGGVIQIFTRKPEGDFSPVLSVGIGSNNTAESSFAVGGKWSDTTLGFSVSHLETDGIDSHVFDGNTDSDDDKFRNTSANVTIGHSFANGAEFSFNLNQSSGENDYDQGNGFAPDPAASPYGKFKVNSANAAIALPVNSIWLSTLSISQSDDENQIRDHNINKFDEFNTHRKQASWQNDIQVTDSYLFTLGYDYYQDEVDGTQIYSQDSRSNRAIFGQLQSELSGLMNVVTGFRRDKNDQFGYQTTYNVAFGFALSDSHRLILSRGTAFKAPTFNDLYWPESPWSSGNSELVPERSNNVEMELRGNYDKLSWTLTAYRNEIDNLINWAETSPFFWQPDNVNSAEIRGSEFSVKTELAQWNLQAIASYSKPEDTDTGNILARRTQKSLTVQLDRRFGKLFVGLNWRSQGNRYDDIANKVKLPGYNVFNISLAYRINENLQARLKVDNVFDSDYQLSKDYNTEGRSALLSLSYSM